MTSPSGSFSSLLRFLDFETLVFLSMVFGSLFPFTFKCHFHVFFSVFFLGSYEEALFGLWYGLLRSSNLICNEICLVIALLLLVFFGHHD